MVNPVRGLMRFNGLLMHCSGSWGALFTNNGQRKNTQALATITGCVAGATESVVVTPFELVKIRMQDKNSTFKGPIDVVRHVFRTAGPLG